MSRRINTDFAFVEGSLGAGDGLAIAGRGPLDPLPYQVRTEDDYLGRLLKYIPAELVGLYLAAKGAIPSTGSDVDLVLWVVAGVTWLMVPFYLYAVTRQKGQPPLWWQIVLGTIAFPVWIFAIGGHPVNSWNWYATHPFIGSLVLMFVTVAFGLKKP